ncbi:MAG: DNA mismatch repair endonuclease MutL, partial [bacterium]|nr:DNA mismatch repair endonuclease MutL [bacterium]
VKELVENAMDAGAADIRVDLEEGGKRLIQVRDNGSGMNRDDALLAFERHATSKIASLADLEQISTMGFRGEALSSIAAVSMMTLTTSDGSQPEATEISIHGGIVQHVRDAGRGQGTTVELRNLFYNTPARKKFLKTTETEFSHIAGIMNDMALAHPEIAFSLRHNGRSRLKVSATDSIIERAHQIFGKEMRENLMGVEEAREGVHLFGLVSIPGYTRPSGTQVNFFVNRRPIRDNTLRHAVYSAYETLLMKGRHPVVYLFIDIDPALVDVNVHPTKREVRFAEARSIHGFLRDGVRKAVQSYGREPLETGSTIDHQGHPREAQVREAVATYLRAAPRGGASMPKAPSRAYEPSSGHRQAGENVRPVASSAPPVQTLFEQTLVPIGQIADSFIITQDKDGLILVDQHAAHERILFERFKKAYHRSRVPVQRLLVPVNMELSQKEGLLLTEHKELLSRLGIETEDLGHGTFTVKSVPMWVADTDAPDLIRRVLQEIETLEQAGDLDRHLDRVIHLFSCRGAVKANSRLKRDEMEKLLNDLGDADSPHTCEHGRPTMIRIDLHEIEKRFKRR